MEDPRLDTGATKINRFFYRLFEDNDAQRMAEPSVLNQFGTQRYLAEIRKRNELQRLYDRANGQFCLGEAFKLNLGRFLFQWVDTFSGVLNNFDAAGRAISKSFGFVFTGGLLNAAMFVGASNYAGTKAYRDDGISLFKFWMYNQAALLLATPVSILSSSFLKSRPQSSPPNFSAFFLNRLLFNSVYSLAIGLYNSNNNWANALYYPLILVSGGLLRASEGFANGATAESVRWNFQALSDPQLIKSQASNFMRGNILAIAAFSALNFVFPITLTQAKGKKGYEKAYFDYLDGKPESE